MKEEEIDITEDAELDSGIETEVIVDLDDEGNEKSLQTKIKELRTKLKEVEKERNEYLDGWQRAKADAINQQKDAEARQKDFSFFATQKLLLEMIPVMDSFQMAMANKEAWNSVDANWRIGIEYIKSQLESVFSNHGLTVFGQVGDIASPEIYTSIETVLTEDSSLDGKVAEILQYGYKLKDKIIREAKCKTYIIN